jgi:glucose/mannose-6-phosphate isomerase
LRTTLLIASSYSGTTEETLDAVKIAFERGMHIAAISTGGALLDFAREHELPFVTIPDTGLEPRMAIGYSMLGLARLMGDSTLEMAIREGGKHSQAGALQSEGTALAQKLIGKTPLIWSSNANLPLAYIWKIKFNETSKIPAFCNSMPELCHNELTGFDVVDSTRDLFSRMHVIMLDDPKDHPRIQKRMHIAHEMLTARNIPIDRVSLKGDGFEKIFNAALLGDWVSLGLARHYGVPNPETPLIAEFKKKMTQ